MSMEDRFKGCIIGSTLGDAVGELAFRYQEEIELIDQINDRDELKYTDDTAMAIGLAESLIEKEGVVDQQHIGDTFRENYQEEPWRGYGQGPPKIFKMVRNEDISYVEGASTLFEGEGSKGNGSAMRIAPVGIFFSKDDSIYEKAVKTAEVTHTHPLGKDGAAVLASAVRRAAVSGKINEVEFAEELAGRAKTETFNESLLKLRDLIEENASREKAAETLGTSVLIEKSVPYAIFSFLKDTDSFKNALMNAIMVPGDRDTIGAMTAGLSGAFLGFESIPKNWVEKVEGLTYLKELAEDLHDIFVRKY